MLGPLDKYVKYGRFPWKFVIHIIMLALTLIEVIIVVGPDLAYSTGFDTQLYQQFMTTDPNSFMPPENNPEVTIFNITQLKEFVNRTITNYYNIASNDNLDFFVPATDQDGFIEPIIMFDYMFDSAFPIVEYELTP